MRDEKRSENCMWAQAIEGDVEDNVEDNEGRDKKFFLFLPFFKEICDCPSVHLNRFFGLRGVLKVKKNLVLGSI